MGSPGEIRLVLESLGAEAKKWRKASDAMARVKSDIDRLSLAPPAFFFADIVSVTGHSAAYSAFHDWMAQLFADATTEFDQVGTALDKSAALYEHSDRQSAVDLSTIYGKRPK
jgi:hypothetical protein